MVLTCSSRAQILATNVGGWDMRLTSRTNCYLIGEPISIIVTVSNMTERFGYVPSTTCSDGQNYLGFCALDVFDLKTGKTPGVQSPSYDSADDRGASIAPKQSASFVYNLTSIYILTNSATYAISLHGKMNAVPELGHPVHSGTPMQVDLSTLYITVGDQSAPTNSIGGSKK